MSTFADLAILLMCFFVLILSFSEMDLRKYKEIVGSMKDAFGVQRQEFAKENPKGTSFVAREFSPGKPDPSQMRQIIQQPTTNRQQRNLEVPTEGNPEVNKENTFVVERAELEAMLKEAQEKASENAQKIRNLLQAEIAAGQVEVEQDGRRITIRIRERGSFDSGRAELIEPFTPVIRKIGQAIELTGGDVVIAGHTDDVPISTRRFRSNWALSAARAVTMFHRLQQVSSLDAERFTVEGHADNEPLVPNTSPSNRARNRRVEVIVVEGSAISSEASATELLLNSENNN